MIQVIRCPSCGHIQSAKVEETMPWWSYAHECTKCEYTMMESEWEEVKYWSKIPSSNDSAPADEIYRDWKIFLEIPNGGIIGVRISREDCWGCCLEIYPELKNRESSDIINFARAFIDRLEERV